MTGFKISEDGLSNGKWATERLATNKGKAYSQIPPCIADGDYLLRAEIIALHEADRVNGAQLYVRRRLNPLLLGEANELSTFVDGMCSS